MCKFHELSKHDKAEALVRLLLLKEVFTEHELEEISQSIFNESAKRAAIESQKEIELALKYDHRGYSSPYIYGKKK